VLRSISWLFVATMLVGILANGVGDVTLAEALTRGVALPVDGGWTAQ
jgi:hypothetical protein